MQTKLLSYLYFLIYNLKVI